MARPWFRFYRKTVNNPKAQKLSPELFRAWVNILCATDDEGRLPSVNDLAFTLRVGEALASEWLSQLMLAKFFNVSRNGVLVANDWSEHNYESDVSTDRVKRFRKRSRNATGNAPDTESDTDTEQNPLSNGDAVGSPSGKPRRGMRWDHAREIPDGTLDAWLEAANRTRRARGLPDIDALLELQRFDNYWSAKSGKDATKLDWRRTWENWCLNAKGNPNAGLNGRDKAAR